MATYPRRQLSPIKSRKDYHVYRQEVREDFNGYCAYCGVHETEWPHNQKNYQLDHFRPKSIFRNMINDFYNLRWCCHICNRVDAKGDIWPTLEEQAMGIGFVDLTEENWYEHYEIHPDGKLEPLTPKATYTIQVIGLNSSDYVQQRLDIICRGGSIFQE